MFSLLQMQEFYPGQRFQVESLGKQLLQEQLKQLSQENGYFINTTSNACTLTLPAGTIGDEVNVIDYAGTFDTNNLTVAADGSEKIHGSTDDLTVAVERAGFALVFSDSTQGWLLKDK